MFSPVPGLCGQALVVGGYRGYKFLRRDAKSFPHVQLSQHQPAPRGTRCWPRLSPSAVPTVPLGLCVWEGKKTCCKTAAGREEQVCDSNNPTDTEARGESTSGQRRDPPAAHGGPQDSRDPPAAQGVMP